MRPRLISVPVCPYAQRARILLNTKQVEHDIDYIDLFDKPAWYLDRVPTGKVPALFVGDDDAIAASVPDDFVEQLAAFFKTDEKPYLAEAAA